MKYLVLKRAFKNFGDYLIFERAVNIMKREIDNFEFDSFDGSKKIPDELIEKYVAFIIPGGPCIRRDLYPGVYPLNSNIFKQRKPVYMLGVGSKLSLIKDSRYTLDPKTINFLKYCNNFGKIGCRDQYTVDLLTKNGISAVMNGCPAWYDFEYFGKRIEKDYKIKKIMVSVPGSELFFEQFIDLLRQILSAGKFETHVSFNHGFDLQKYKYLYESLKNLPIIMHDMSGGTSKAHIYDAMDAHVGYRVHTNIYFLSHRKPSILIAEDSRGKGIIETLGLPGTPGYDYRKKLQYHVNQGLNKITKKSKIRFNLDKNVLSFVENELETLSNMDFNVFNDIFSKMEKTYYDNMKLFIKSIIQER